MDRKFRDVSRLRLVDDVRRSLEESILAGQIRPGERLAEAWLADQFSVSRTTVREALLMLQRQGHVVNVPRHGTYVRRLSPEEAADLCAVRALLESYAVRLAWTRIGQAIYDKLEAQISAMTACRLPADLPRLVQIDLTFHRTLVDEAGSPHLSEAFANLDAQIGALFIGSVERRNLAIDDVVAGHRQLLEALRSADATLAQAAVVEHYVNAESRAARRGGLFETVNGTANGVGVPVR